MSESMGPLDRRDAIKAAKSLFRLDENAEVSRDDIMIALAETTRRAEARFGPVSTRMVHAAKLILDDALMRNQDSYDHGTCLEVADVRKALEAAFLVAPDVPRTEILEG